MTDPDPMYFTLIKIAIILISSFIIVKWAMFILRKTGKKLNMEPTLIQVINEIIKYSVLAVAITVVVKEVGWDISGIIVSLGIVGVAVGFAARDTLSNFISGMFILADKSFKIGDIIEISGKSGTVMKLGFRVTTIKPTDNKIITIPNSNFSKNIYLNYTAEETRKVELDINIPYEMDLDVTVVSLVNAASNCKWVLKEPKPNVLIKEMGDTSIRASLNVWVSDPWKVATYRSQLAMKVKELLVGRDSSENVKV
jgi:small conductance mechanosensitive channel